MTNKPTCPTGREARALREILLATSDRIDWMRNHIGVAHYPGGAVVRYGCGGPGGSDLIGCVRGSGRMFVCEVKSASGRPTDEQLQFLQRMRDAGALACVARSPDDVLRELGEAP